MVSQFTRAKQNPDVATRDINMKRVRLNSEAKKSSPDFFTDEFEAERIDETYIKEEYKDLIIDKESSRRAMLSLITDPKTGLRDDFENLITGVGFKGREDFIEYLVGKYGDPKKEIIKGSALELKSGKETRGLKVNEDTYLQVYDDQVRARDFKTGKFKKLKPEYYKDIG